MDTPLSASGPAVGSSRLLIDADRFETRAAVIEDGEVVELHLERSAELSLVGAVFSGKVHRVLPGMNAAFVDIGRERHGYLFAAEAAPTVDPGVSSVERRRRPIGELVRAGERLLVQVVRDASAGKGARLTARLSFPGRLLVLMPGSGPGGCAISRRIEWDDERERLQAIVADLLPGDSSAIVRTAAEGASADELAADLEVLHRSWRELSDRAATSRCPSLVRPAERLHLSMVRDQPPGGWASIEVAGEDAGREIEEYLARCAPACTPRLRHERADLMARNGVEAAIVKSFRRRVWLRRGAYLELDVTEALTTIDVNTGSYVGRGSFETTALSANLEAAREAARQIRLRDLGGIIVIDFIDMASRESVDRLYETLRRELARDRVTTRVAPPSDFGLVEVTRKRSRPNLRRQMTERCPTCGGDRRVIDPESAALRMRRRVLARNAESASGEIRVDVSRRLGGFLAGAGKSVIADLESVLGPRLEIATDDRLGSCEFEVRGG